MKQKSIFENFWVLHFFGLFVLLFLLSIGYAQYQKHQLTLMTSREVAMMCTSDMATQFHIHPNLKIIILGKKYTIPDNIWITSTCMHSIHTHVQEDGKLHVEAEVQKDFTLSDFFAVLGKTFTKDQILENKTDVTHKIILKVNEKEVKTFENTILKDGDMLEIDYIEVK